MPLNPFKFMKIQSTSFQKHLTMNSTKQPLINKKDEQNNYVNKEDHQHCSSCNSISILTFLLITCVTILFFLVLLLPRWPIITIKEALVTDYTFTTHHHLNAAFNFEVRVHNPNTRLSLYYDHIVFRAYHGGEVVGYEGVEPFLQPHENLTLLRFGGVASDMPLFESKQGEVELVLELKGRLWFKVGSFSLYWYNMQVMCFPVVVYLDPTRGFERTSCYLMLE